ncbi:hypothetical protein, partial [Glaciimonas soli]
MSKLLNKAKPSSLTQLNVADENNASWDDGIKAPTQMPSSTGLSSQAQTDIRERDKHIDALASRAAEPSSHINERLALILAARNPLYEAAKPILLTL